MRRDIHLRRCVTTARHTSRHLARALGTLLRDDELATSEGALTPRGRFVLHVGGGPEGRLLLRLVEDGALEPLPDEARFTLLGLLAEGGALPPDAPGMAAALPAYRAALSVQIAAERAAGVALTPPPAAQPPRHARSTSGASRQRPPTCSSGGYAPHASPQRRPLSRPGERRCWPS